MLSYGGNCPGKARGVHVRGGNGFTTSGPLGLGAKREPRGGCKEAEGLLLTQRGWITCKGLHSFQGKIVQERKPDTAL